jgi:serine/threonine-protein kinase
MTSDRSQNAKAPDPESAATLIDRVCDQFEQAWRDGQHPNVDDYLDSVAEPLRSRLFEELLLSELELCVQLGETVETNAMLARFPDRQTQVRHVISQFWQRASKRSPLTGGRQTGGRQTGVDRGKSPGSPEKLIGQEYGNYELLQEVARGGMGVVFKAYDTKLQRTVALKMILDRNLASKEAVQRFYTEAETAAGLNHPGIVPVYDVGSHGGQHYYAMGFVEGPTLSDELRRRRFSMEESARLVLELAWAVAYAHECGVVHRDLKPGNILLSPEGQPQITDFGLAKRTNRPSYLTMDGQVLGTPGYMAPEQAAGDVEHSGTAVDVYALGAILYHLVTGYPPFRTALDAWASVLVQDPMPPRGINRRVPRDLDVICMKCLSKNPADRYATVQQLADDLQRYLDGELIQARPASLPRRLQRWARHRPRLASVLVTMIAFYIHHLILYTGGHPKSSDELFHWQATGAVLLVCCYAWGYQIMLMSPRAKRIVLYAWVGTDILVFTLFLVFAAAGARSPLVVIYFCMVAGAALTFDRYMVWWITGACLISYAVLVPAAQWYQPGLERMTYREAMPMMISMLAIGVIQYYVLRCARIQLGNRLEEQYTIKRRKSGSP